MKCVFSKVVYIFVLFSTLTFAQKTRKTVFIIADGISLDNIQTYPMPNLKEFTKNGAFISSYVGGQKDDYTETPTISAVGYNSLLTSTWVNKHNVWDNDIKAPNYNYWNVFRLFKNAYPKKTTAIFSTWLYNRTKLIGSDAKEAGNLQPEFVFDGYELDSLKFPHDKDGNFYNLIDNFVIEKASQTIKKSAPDLSWIYLEYTDEMGHRHGDSPQFDFALSQVDQQIKKINEAVKFREKNYNEEWLVILTTDHGRDITGYNHGSQSHREKTTWMATNYCKFNKYAKTAQPPIVDIIPTILRFMNVKVPKNRLFEMDGIPMIGEISGTDLRVKFENNQLKINWLSANDEGKAKIWLSTTNNFAKGGKDDYILVKEVPVNAYETTIDIKNYPSKFYKIVLEMPYNTLNRWVFVK